MNRRCGCFFKRLIDITISAPLLVILSPLLLVIGLAIAVESPGPVLYRCKRVGRFGEDFWLLKFRKMRVDASGPPLTLSSDARFTRIGKFLAGTKLDELPQFWSVLRGDMSLVGPRPEDRDFVDLAPEYSVILSMRPGITGLSQLAFARETSILDPTDVVHDYIHRIFPLKVRIDQLYIARWSLFLDLRILLWTFVVVPGRREVAVDRSSARIGLRKGR